VTELLRKAVETLSELPPEKQDAFAAMVLDEVAIECAPDRPLVSIAELDEEARAEYLAGKTEPMTF